MSDSVNWQALVKEPVPGSAPQELKERVTGTFYMLMTRGSGFGDSILRRARVTEISLEAKRSEPTKKEATVICELDVEEGRSYSISPFIVFKAGIVLICCLLRIVTDMTNVLGNVHGGKYHASCIYICLISDTVSVVVIRMLCLSSRLVSHLSPSRASLIHVDILSYVSDLNILVL